MTASHISRRQMIVASGIVVTGLFQADRATAQSPNTSANDAGDLIFRTTDPRNAEPPLDKLVQSWITPTDQFYVRSHAPNPVIDPKAFRLKIAGLVRKPLSLSLDDLKQHPEHTVTATLTCAGNRRIEFNKQAKVGGVQWEAGAIGNATWTGVALADVLKQAGVQDGARHIWFDGLDDVPHEGGIIPFGASVPIEKVMEGEQGIGALLVYAMNGEPLTPDHGFPLRTIVPGYIGARSVKWLGSVTASAETSPNHYLATAYKVVTKTDPIDWSETAPIYRNVINAAIGTIEGQAVAQAKLSAGTVALKGYVMPSGLVGAKVDKVQLSVDSGKSWGVAELTNEEDAYCWRLWKANVTVTPQSKELIVRANDSKGAFMPARVPWNAKGYLQNSWYRVPIEVI
jgi:sulfite oxidase